MPHLVILYTPNLDDPLDAGGTDMTQLCRSLANTMIAARDEAYQAVFPVGGVRVLAYPAAHHAVADDGSAGRPRMKASSTSTLGAMKRAMGMSPPDSKNMSSISGA